MGWRKYPELVRIGFREAVAYRLDAVMSLATSLFYLVLAYYIWSAIAASGSLNSSLTQVMTYLVVGQIVSNTTEAGIENFIGEKVRKGTVVNELKRPLSLRSHAYFFHLGWAVFHLLTKALPVALLGYFFLGLTFPTGWNAVGFAVSLLLSLNLVFFLSYLTAMFVFWTKVAWSLRSMRNTIQRLFSGVLFPLYLLPENLKPVFYATPFPSMVDLPIQIFQSQVSGGEMLSLFGGQLFWIVVLAVLGEIVWRKARKNLTVQGG